jgi:hypothetical protein
LRVGGGDDEAEADLGDVDGDAVLSDVERLVSRFMMNKVKKINIVNKAVGKDFCRNKQLKILI